VAFDSSGSETDHAGGRSRISITFCLRGCDFSILNASFRPRLDHRVIRHLLEMGGAFLFCALLLACFREVAQ